MFPSDLTTDALAAAINGTMVRQKAISHNLANADTPGFRRLDVSFEGALASALEEARDARARGRPSAEALSGFAPSIRADVTTVMRVDGNNVDPDNEMAQLAANQLAHQTLVGLLDKKFTQLRAAITGR